MMMKVSFVVALIFFLFSLSYQSACPYAQYVQFTQKDIDHPFNIIKNPYDNPSE